MLCENVRFQVREKAIRQSVNVYFRKSILKSLKICILIKKITVKIAVE